ncbi:MAG: hypothetical protein RIF44_08680, partial [Nitratireductor sp.]
MRYLVDGPAFDKPKCRITPINMPQNGFVRAKNTGTDGETRPFLAVKAWREDGGRIGPGGGRQVRKFTVKKLKNNDILRR